MPAPYPLLMPASARSSKGPPLSLSLCLFLSLSLSLSLFLSLSASRSLSLGSGQLVFDTDLVVLCSLSLSLTFAPSLHPIPLGGGLEGWGVGVQIKSSLRLAGTILQMTPLALQSKDAGARRAAESLWSCTYLPLWR